MARFVTQDAKAIDMAKQYRAASSVERLAKEEKDDAKQFLLGFMDGAGVAVMEAGRNVVTVTRYTTAKFDITRFRKEMPELAKEYTQDIEQVRIIVKDA